MNALGISDPQDAPMNAQGIRDLLAAQYDFPEEILKKNRYVNIEINMNFHPPINKTYQI